MLWGVSEVAGASDHSTEKLRWAKVVWQSDGSPNLLVAGQAFRMSDFEVRSVAHRYPCSLRIELALAGRAPSAHTATWGPLWLLAVPLWALRVEVEPIPSVVWDACVPLMAGCDGAIHPETATWSDVGPLSVKRLSARLYELWLYKENDVLLFAHAARLAWLYRTA